MFSTSRRSCSFWASMKTKPLTWSTAKTDKICSLLPIFRSSTNLCMRQNTKCFSRPIYKHKSNGVSRSNTIMGLKLKQKTQYNIPHTWLSILEDLGQLEQEHPVSHHRLHSSYINPEPAVYLSSIILSYYSWLISSSLGTTIQEFSSFPLASLPFASKSGSSSISASNR